MAFFIHVLKMIFLFCLIGVCFFVFGFDFIARFLARETTVNESLEQKQALKPPAITICPQVGWKNSNFSTAGFRVHCKNANSSDMFWKCLEERTYNFSEIILSATHGHPLNVVKTLTDGPKFWTWSTPGRSEGRCFTLLYDQHFQIDMKTDVIVINLKPPSRYYTVFLHDPDFFVITYNPFTLPVTEIDINPAELNEKTHLLLSMAQMKTKKLNKPEMPCNPSPRYSFTTCVRQSVATKSNCSLPWDPLDQGNDDMQLLVAKVIKRRLKQ